MIKATLGLTRSLCRKHTHTKNFSVSLAFRPISLELFDRNSHHDFVHFIIATRLDEIDNFFSLRCHSIMWQKCLHIRSRFFSGVIIDKPRKNYFIERVFTVWDLYRVSFLALWCSRGNWWVRSLFVEFWKEKGRDCGDCKADCSWRIFNLHEILIGCERFNLKYSNKSFWKRLIKDFCSEGVFYWVLSRIKGIIASGKVLKFTEI